jgi:hypothetical protein
MKSGQASRWRSCPDLNSWIVVGCYEFLAIMPTKITNTTAIINPAIVHLLSIKHKKNPPDQKARGKGR